MHVVSHWRGADSLGSQGCWSFGRHTVSLGRHAVPSPRNTSRTFWKACCSLSTEHISYLLEGMLFLLEDMLFPLEGMLFAFSGRHIILTGMHAVPPGRDAVRSVWKTLFHLEEMAFSLSGRHTAPLGWDSVRSVCDDLFQVEQYVFQTEQTPSLPRGTVCLPDRANMLAFWKGCYSFRRDLISPGRNVVPSERGTIFSEGILLLQKGSLFFGSSWQGCERSLIFNSLNSILALYLPFLILRCSVSKTGTKLWDGS